jgi:23S rRNA pseudouridine2605 synthase
MLVSLNRALSKLGILSRAQATEAIIAGRVRVDGRVVRDPRTAIIPERVRITVDGKAQTRSTWRTILVHKPRGVVVTRRDPEGRPTIYDVLGGAAQGLVPVGRLDRATSGLLLLTNDTRLADRITDPANALPREYVVSVRGLVSDQAAASMNTPGTAVAIRKASGRETHLVVELRQGRNREIRRLFEAAGHEVTRLKRVRFGRLELGELQPGQWREMTKAQVEAAFGRDKAGLKGPPSVR